MHLTSDFPRGWQHALPEQTGPTVTVPCNVPSPAQGTRKSRRSAARRNTICRGAAPCRPGAPGLPSGQTAAPAKVTSPVPATSSHPRPEQPGNQVAPKGRAALEVPQGPPPGQPSLRLSRIPPRPSPGGGEDRVLACWTSRGARSLGKAQTHPLLPPGSKGGQRQTEVAPPSGGGGRGRGGGGREGRWLPGLGTGRKEDRWAYHTCARGSPGSCCSRTPFLTHRSPLAMFKWQPQPTRKVPTAGLVPSPRAVQADPAVFLRRRGRHPRPRPPGFLGPRPAGCTCEGSTGGG